MSREDASRSTPSAKQSAAKQSSAKQSSAKPSQRLQRTEIATHRQGWLRRGDWGRRVVAIWAFTAATATAFDLGVVRWFERQAQTLFFTTRGEVAQPPEVVILTIDDSSLSQGEFFRVDPQKYAALEPIQAWPWQRSAYAIAIDKLMASGVKAIGIDVIFSTPSSYGDADDERFAQALQQHAGRVILAAQYSESETPQGYITQLVTPLSRFCNTPQCSGFINFLIEPDGRIHQLGEQFLTQLLQNSPPAQAQVLERRSAFAHAILDAARIKYPPATGDTISFYGSARTFEHIPFWYVLDSTAWKTTLQSGAYFKGKIVLIGATATRLQDFHPTPFSESWLYPEPMPGVEIHANAIATLLEGKSIAEALPHAAWRGVLVLIGLGGVGLLLTRPQQPLKRLNRAMALAGAWLAAGYFLFVYAQVIVPTALPVGAIVLSGISQLVVGTVKEQVRKQRLRDTLKQYVTSPIVQEIISQDDDLQDLLYDRELALAGKVLGNRYRISKVLGAGGFSETYVAEDLQRPGQPACVVKQLKVVSDNPNTLRLAQRLFVTEAETLERLGQHPQIPQLLAYFEENQEFYLVQELIQGHPLSRELLPGRTLPETEVVNILSDLLGILDFVHRQGVIHRDLKPSNIMRQRSNGRLVLIDFGIAKRITTQLAESSEQTKFTIPVGTPGYMPGEQSAGRPHFNSDIYALGMIGIEALTGLAPRTLNYDVETGAVIWESQVPGASAGLKMILNKMVHYDFLQRYQSVHEVQVDLALFARSLTTPELVLDDALPSADKRSADTGDQSQEQTEEQQRKNHPGENVGDENIGDDDEESMTEDTTVAWLNDQINS